MKKVQRYSVQKVTGDGRCMFRALVRNKDYLLNFRFICAYSFVSYVVIMLYLIDCWVAQDHAYILCDTLVAFLK